MPILYEDVEDEKPLSDKERRRLAERRAYATGKRQLRYNERNFLKIKEYLRNYYYDNKDKRAREYGLEPLNPENIPSDRHVRSVKLQRLFNNIKASKKNPIRTRVCLQDVKNIMYEILRRRCDNYKDKSTMKKKIMCIVGASGAGKTLASLHLQTHLGANVICSFTTRPPRDTEVEGRDHHFVDIEPPQDDVLAQAKFGGYMYYALKSQVYGPCTVYVVDEAGVRDLVERHSDEFEIFTVNVLRDKKLRLERGIDIVRMLRDKRRKPLESFDYVVNNDSTKAKFFEQIERIYNEIKGK